MSKLLTTAFLMTLVSATYGQELTYLHCDNNQKNFLGDPSRVLVLNAESLEWDWFTIFYDEALEANLDQEIILDRNKKVSGNLKLKIISSTSSSFSLKVTTLPDDRATYLLDRITGELSIGEGWTYNTTGQLWANCSVIEKASLDNLLQGRIDLRNEMIRANEAKRLF